MLDEAFSALSNVHRRRVMMSLAEHNPQKDTSIHVPEDVHVGEKELDDLQIELYHTHLPQLEEAGFIRWKKDEHEIVKGPRFEEVRPVVELIANSTDELPDNQV